MNRRSILISTLAFGLTFASAAHARECEGVTMHDAVQVDGTSLVLNGMGVREATAFNVNVYVAGLYLEHRSSSGAAILGSLGRTRLVLRFVRDVSRSDMVDALAQGFARSAGSNLAALQPRIQQLQGWMPGLSNNSELTFTYVPGTGVEVRVGTTVRGTIAGEDFARALFGIWLGSSPPNAGLRTGLLGGACG